MSTTLEPVEVKAADALLPSRRWDDTPVLVALVAIVAAAVWLGTLVGPRQPGDASAEAGFARDMSAHHAQGVELAELARSRTADEEVRILATDIALTQQAQIGMMSVWLKDWHLNPTGTRPPMAWMPGGAGHLVNGLMPGMATPAQITKLENSTGKAFDILYCQLMLRHHVGGIHMVEGILALSHNGQVHDLATAMLTAQQSEIIAFQHFLQDLGAPPLSI